MICDCEFLSEKFYIDCFTLNALARIVGFLRKMATVVSVNEVKVFIEKTVEKELYISKSEKFVKLQDFLKKSSLEKVVERYVDIYDERR